MTPKELSFDVTTAIGTGEPLIQTAWLFQPEGPPKAALLCLAGGTYDKHYWHLEIPGHPGYSFAEHLAARGYLVVTADHLGVGGSSDPGESGPVGLELLAKGDVEVAVRVHTGLLEGTLTGQPLDIPFIGVGHSMGACLTTMVQSKARPFDAVALFGYGVQISNVYEDDNSAEELAARIAQSEALFRDINGIGPDATSCVAPRSNLRALFHGPGVPEAVMAADDAAESRVPVRAASEVITPGFVQEFAAEVGVPVFLGFGGHLDVSPDPRTELTNYPASPDVTLYLVEGSGHCHNFAGNRTRLWDRVASWVPAVTGKEAAAPAR
jgi:alpha-beta hydrolase superfamily lysophospholipase